MLSFLSHYAPVSDGVPSQAPRRPRNRGDGVSRSARAQQALRKVQGPFPFDNVTRRDIGEIAVAGLAAGHRHNSRLLRNRSDGYFRKFSAHAVARVACDVKAFAFIQYIRPATWSPRFERQRCTHGHGALQVRCFRRNRRGDGGLASATLVPCEEHSCFILSHRMPAPPRRRQCGRQSTTRVQKR